jgi:hypothetical protein
MGARLIKTGLAEKTIHPKNKISFSIEELRKLVGGEIQIVILDDKYLMILNECAKLNNPLGINIIASKILKDHKLMEYGQFVVGDVVVVERELVV